MLQPELAQSAELSQLSAGRIWGATQASKARKPKKIVISPVSSDKKSLSAAVNVVGHHDTS